MSVWSAVTSGALGIEHPKTGMKKLGVDTLLQTLTLAINVIKLTRQKDKTYNETRRNPEKS
jgi:hypothetical protein